MKIIVEQALGRMALGITSSFAMIPDCHVAFWDSSTKASMDMFDEFKPDLVFASSSQLKDEAFAIAVSRYPNSAVISIGDVNQKLINPILSINNTSKDDMPNIEFEGGVMLGKIGKPEYDDSLSSDVLCLTEDILPTEENQNVLHFLSSSYNTKILGPVHFDVASYLGVVNDQQRATALASTKVFVDLGSESKYDALWLGKHVVEASSNISKLKTAIDKGIEEGENIIGKIRVKNKTYFDLCAQILSFLGMNQPASFLMNKKGEALV